MREDYSQLVIDIKKKSKNKVSTVRDLKYLQEDIYSITSKNISFNTLRRFFGFLSPTNPSVATLNVLAAYLGFNSYVNYLSNRETYAEWYFQMKTLRLQLNEKELEKNDVIEFKYALQNENNIFAIANYLNYLIEKNKTESLSIFFQYFDYTKLSDSSLSKFAILATFSFYKIETEIRLNIYKNLIQFESFRNAIPLYFIDYSHLNGYYIKVIKMIKKININESDYLFCSLMEFYQKFYSNKEYSELIIKLPENTAQIFPVLIGRYYGYRILSAKKNDKFIEKSIKKELKNHPPHLFLIEIFPALIIKEEYTFLTTLIKQYYEEIFEMDRWSSKSTVANYLIGMASLDIHNGNLKAAKNNLKLVELDKIELAYTDYISLFYFLTKIKLHFYEGNQTKVQESYIELEKITNRIGFTRFISISKKYIQS